MQIRTDIVMLFDIVCIHRRNAIIYWAVTIHMKIRTDIVMLFDIVFS